MRDRRKHLVLRIARPRLWRGHAQLKKKNYIPTEKLNRGWCTSYHIFRQDGGGLGDH